MSTGEVTKRIPQVPPRAISRFIGAYYLLTILTGAFVLLFHGRLAFAVDVVVAAFYFAVTAFLYGLSVSSNRNKTQ
jgi:hypothetical protein